MQNKQQSFNGKMLAFCGASIGIAYVLSFIKLFRMPQGGSVTLCAMLFATLPGWFFGPAAGFISAFAYGLLKFVTNPMAYSFLQVVFDYLLAYTALGLCGFFHRKKNGLLFGYITAIAGRFVFACLASLFFWTDFTDMTLVEGIWFAMTYNAGYILPEGLITIVILLLPPVRKGLQRIKALSGKKAE